LNKTYLKLSLDLDFVLIAITASLKDYVLCHKINNALNFELCKIDDHEIFLNADDHEPLCFSKYYFFVEEGELEYYLLSNRNSEGFLIPEMNKVDFFMVIHQYIDKEDLNLVIGRLNKMPDIQVAAQIDVRKLKSKENLVM
jgi:hypothetical protein